MNNINKLAVNCVVKDSEVVKPQDFYLPHPGRKEWMGTVYAVPVVKG
jgi:hypothetical protein